MMDKCTMQVVGNGAARAALVLALLASLVFADGGLVSRSNVLTVKVGRTLYLNTNDLVIRKARRDDEGCRVEVVQNDPITQRVGKLEPKIFDCQFQPNTVRYIHSGSPFLSEDIVKLRIHRFTSRKTITETFYLNVKVVNATTDIVVTRGLRHVIVPEFNGISNPIDTSVIRFHHSRSPNVSCTVSFNKWDSHWPLVGHIVMGDQRSPVEGLKKTCNEFLYMELRYEHLQKPTPDVDFLPLSIELFDPATSDEVITERFYLPIYIKHALLNSPPRSSFMSMYMMDVDEFVLSTIIPGIISAEDYETPNSLLVYNISKPPGQDQGYFVSLDDHTTEITSFLQDDLENHRIGYQPPNNSFSERRIYEVEFKVFDSHFSESMPIVLHIAVRPSSTTAPRVSFNKGLVLLEGQTREINSNDIQIVDKDNLDDVRIYITGGLKHGQFLVNNKLSVYFTMADLVAGNLKYVHDDSESFKDHIDFKISDGSDNVLVNFPIIIIPKDDNPPYMINNLGMELNEGQTKRIETSALLAHDTDSVDLNIIYFISQPTAAGEIIRKLRPTDTGARVNRFTQRELTKGQIYYRHFGKEEFVDEFLFNLRDQNDPPNESDIEAFYISINPVNENPPQLSPDATRLMHVAETDIALITRAELEYTDSETSADRLTYTITTEPYFANDKKNIKDAGRIISLHNVTMLVKDERIPAVSTFKQDDINYLKIGYMPPMDDIGSEARLVRFLYTVQDSNGNKVFDQQFDIDVQPVNDKAPEFVSSKMLVEEGGILGISVDQLSATDEDTNEANLLFILESSPEHGRLQKGGVNLDEKDTFDMLDLRKKNLRYIHDGSEILMDTFTLSASDGDNTVSKVFEIEIVPVDDEAPRVRDNLRPHLIVSEGSEAVITSKVMAATDEDTEDGSLIFLIVKQPKYGSMRLREEPATKFTQDDVKNGDVRYIHSSGEIGSHSIRDSVTFIVSDHHYKASADLPMWSLNITITPVDNQKPTVIADNPIVVEEGMKIVFSPDVLTAKDPDTEPEYIQFIVTRPPQWGYLENIKPNPGSEKRNAGIPITTFQLQDIIDQSINYIQATHKGVEPTEDSFEFYATDGTLNSPAHSAYIIIKPMNDEEPDVMLNDIHVQEGGSMVIDQSMLDAIDLDMPKDSVVFSISQPPEHGDIVVMLHTANGDIEATVKDFTVDELHNGLKLKYRHDNSEHFTDKFAITASDGLHEVKKVCNISIVSVNDEGPEITKNAGLYMEYGESAILSSVVLQSFDGDTHENDLYYIIVSVPKKGVLQFCTDPHAPMFSSSCRDIQVGQNFTQRDVNNNNIRYLHTTVMSGSEFDSFMFILTDGHNKRHVETFQIRIMNSKKESIALVNKGIDIREGQRVVITTDHLSATDESTRAEEIVFAVIRPPLLGQLEYIDKNFVPISSFTQLDLAGQRIVYNHLTKTDFTEDSFTFTVTNGMSDAKDAEFQIRIDPLDKVLPSLVQNSLVEVLQGSEVAIDSNNLRAEDPDTDSSNVTYHIKKQPTYGRLYNRGVYVTSVFTQSAVDRGFVTYESDGTHTGLDNFLFTISDGRHEGFMVNGTLHIQPAMVSIFIKPLVNDKPRIINLKHPEMLEEFEDGRYGFEMNSFILKAVDSDTTNNQLVYIIEQKPKHGHLENNKAKRYVRRRFTQKDLDENSLQFIIDLKDKETNDSFTFSVRDNRGNTLNNQRMEFRWSYIEFEKTGLVVCENIGTLSLTLVRLGDLSGTAFVTIEAHDRSTAVDQDYVSSNARQVQFDPGMPTATWDIRILDDRLVENTENLLIYIKEPINAVLGRKRKLRIRLINAENGECPHYLGMIDKHRRTIPDAVYLPDNSIEAQTDTVLERGSTFTGINVKNPFDNTYNTDPAETGSPGAADKARTSDLNPTQFAPAEGGKKRRNKRKRRRRKKPKMEKKPKGQSEDNVQPDEHRAAGQVLTNVDINAPKDCALATKELMYFDTETQQMYKCNGVAWQAWSPASNQDQQPETRECQQGWSMFENRCFKFINERLTWEFARGLCNQSHGAHLATVRSKKHQAWLSELSGSKSYWIGLNDRENTGDWKYDTVDEITFSNWGKSGSRAKRNLARKKCVLVNKKSVWKAKICNKRTSRLICEKDIGLVQDRRESLKRDTTTNGKSRPKRKRSKFKDKDGQRRHSKRQTDLKKKNKSSRSSRTTKNGFFFGS